MIESPWRSSLTASEGIGYILSPGAVLSDTYLQKRLVKLSFFFILLHFSREVLTFLLPRPLGDSRVPWVPLGASWLPPGCLLGASLVSPGCLLGVSWVLPWSPDVSQMPPRCVSDASQAIQFNSIQFTSIQFNSIQFNSNQNKSNKIK